MKLVFKATPKMVKAIFDQLIEESNTFNSMERLVNGKVVQIGVTYLSDGDSWDGYVPDANDSNLHRERIAFSETPEFGWTTSGGSRLWVNAVTGIVTITGSRRGIRDRFSDVICVGWNGEGECRFTPAPGRLVGDVDWSKYNRDFKEGLELVEYVSSEPSWEWYQTADDLIKSVTGKEVYQLKDKSVKWLAASGLSQKHINNILSLR